METIKTALGFGGTQSQSTKEPHSDQTGAGTTTDPHDAGDAGQSGLGKESPEDVLKTSKPQPNQEPIAGGTNAGISGETHDTGNTLSQPDPTSVENHDELPKDSLPKDGIPKDELAKDELQKDELAKDELPKDIESQSGQEPLSGHTGAGTAEDPYDAGNATGQTVASAEEITDKTANEAASSTVKSPPSVIPTDTATYPGLQGHPLINTEPTPPPAITSNTTDRDAISTSEPSTDPISSQEPTYNKQGADHPLEVPSSEQTDAIIGEKTETEGTQAGEPVSDVLPPTEAPKSEVQSEKPPGAIPDAGQEQTHLQDPTEDTSESKGTGEKYIKSTGLAAEGGDFDAANPGAGKEADRLLIGSEADHGETSTATADSDLADSTKKMKLSDKIKGKLHLKKHSSAD